MRSPLDRNYPDESLLTSPAPLLGPFWHPFFLDSSGLNNNAAVHLGASDGVTEGTTQLRYDVPASTTLTTVFYQCALHNAMSGTITITDAPPVPALGTTATVALVALVLALGFVALRRKNRAA